MPHFPKAKPKPWIYKKPKAKSSGHNTRQRDERDKFYNTTQWRKLREHHLQNYPLCEWCKELDKTTIANVVDHKLRIKAGGDPLAMDNLQSLCTKCHATKSGYEAHENKKKN